MYQSFKHYDTDRSGEIDFSELFNLIKGLGIKLEKHEVADALQQLDKDNSGTVSYEEFQKYWRVLLQASAGGYLGTRSAFAHTIMLARVLD